MKSWIRENSSVLVGVLLGTLLISPRLLFPMQMDQYFHHYLGWRLAEGELPYLGSYDQNFPGGAILHAICILIFGQSSFAFATFDLILQSISCYFLARTAQRLYGAQAAILAPAIYSMTYIGLGIWNIGQRDAFIVPFLAYVVWRLADNRSTAQTLAPIGLACGFIILLRPMFILFAFFVAGYIWWRNRKPDQALLLLAYGAIPSLLIIVIYLSIGELRTLYESTIQFNLEVYGKFRHGVSMRGSGTMTLIFIWGLVGLAHLMYRRRAYSSELTPVFAATLIAPISTFIQGQGDAHHMTPSYAMASIWCAIGIATIIRDVFKPRSRTRLHIGLAIAVGLIVLRGADRLPWDSIKAYAAGKSLKEIHASSRSTDVHLAEEFAVANYLEPSLLPGDHLYIWSMRIWPYQLTGHPAPTRFQTHEHLLMQPKGQPLTDLQLKWRAEFMQDIQASPPKYVLWTTTDNLWLLPNAESSKYQLMRFPEFQSFVIANYALDTTIGGFEILRKL